ncbi:DeoR/GlpR family DNA-binding transcription regulator [Halonatronum saccharophilum]|uniref:DeoR/GlpR family DNA-binding transcription regulator n=1 Tax=Halonatronum saccharophilum TaxID=150060 RepID=UPI00047F3EF9|nr:DeoR/GlpR family DNA-binding transcription regulator [Halonatronum saccharophilum]
MIKEERLEKIMEILDEEGLIKVSEITELLGVTEMTIRRDLNILEGRGLLIRVHGGAKKKEKKILKELTHNEKKEINTEEKRHIAEIAATFIEDNDTIYIGPGTTCEFIYDYIDAQNIKVVTNSISIFSKFADDKRFELILAGGRLRPSTGTFVGSFTNELLTKLSVKAAFVGANGIYKNYITTSNEEEGVAQNIILDNSLEKYVLADHEKIDRQDFYSFYNLEDVTALITDKNLKKGVKRRYSEFIKIID